MATYRPIKLPIAKGLLLGLLVPLCQPAWSYGTGADGEFNPQVDTELQLPADGIFNFTEITVPSGVVVTFIKNDLNTPVTFLATGDVVIDGEINLSGKGSTHSGTSSSDGGNVGDDGLPGEGGPGGYDGGLGGNVSAFQGGFGLGPGGGRPSLDWEPGEFGCGGGGGGYGSAGARGTGNDITGDTNDCDNDETGTGGPTYGSAALLPLLGGSGGGGSSSGQTYGGSGGGGGGGAILLASAATITVNGSIRANGGNTGNVSGTLSGGSGGAGSGGGIRLVADTVQGNGTMQAVGGADGSAIDSTNRGGDGGVGRIRIEANNMLRTSNTDPTYSFGAPGELFLTGAPTLRITSVAGVAAPTSPTGVADIVLPETTVNPVSVTFETTGIPEGNTVELTLSPAQGASTSVTSPALIGDETSATAAVDIDLPDGPSTMLAEVSFTVTIAMNQELRLDRFVGRGERVTTMRLSQGSAGSLATLITDNGREYQVPTARLAI